MNFLSAVPRSESIFFPLIIGMFFLWNFSFMLALGKGNMFVIGILLCPFSGAQMQYNWLFFLFIFVFSYMLGKFFMLLGDFLLASLFSGKAFNIGNLISSGKQVVIERVFLSKNYPNITTKVFLDIEESYHLSKSEYYYSLSRFFSGLFLSFLILILLEIFVFHFCDDINLCFKITWFLFVIASGILVAKKTTNYLFFLPLVLILALSIDCFLEITLILENEKHFKSLKSIIDIITIAELIMVVLSYFLAIWSRELANYFLYLSYLKANKEKKEGK